MITLTSTHVLGINCQLHSSFNSGFRMWPFVEGEAGMKNGFVQFCQRLQTCTTTKAYHPKKLKPRFHRQPSPSRNPAESYSFGDATISFPSKPDDWHLGSLFPNPCVCLRFLRDDGHSIVMSREGLRMAYSKNAVRSVCMYACRWGEDPKQGLSHDF